jgi:hypothetical protein
VPPTTKRQAHYMSALAHGWNPPGKHPSRAVAEDFHRADKRKAIWEHATGGPAGGSPLDSVLGQSSPGGGFGNPLAVHHIGGNPSMSLGMAHMRMPRIPIEGTLRNIDQHIGGAQAKLPKLATSMAGHGFPKPKLAKGGKLSPDMVQALRSALMELAVKANANRQSLPPMLQSAPRPVPQPQGLPQGTLGQIQARIPPQQLMQRS